MANDSKTKINVKRETRNDKRIHHRRRTLAAKPPKGGYFSVKIGDQPTQPTFAGQQ